MGLPAINSLQNMEFMLYGGASGYNSSCPSLANGYKGSVQNNVSNPYGFNYGYPNYNPYNVPFYGYPQQQLNNDVFQSQAAAQQSQAAASQAQNPTAFGASQEDLDILTKYYMTDMAPSESLKGAAIGGAAFGLMNNMRFIAHPWNATTAIKASEGVFKDAAVKNVFKEYMSGAEVGKIGETVIKGNAAREVMFDAYGQLHRLETLAHKNRWHSLFKGNIKNLGNNSEIYKKLKDGLVGALKSGDAQKIAEATEQVKIATQAKTGWLPRLFKGGKEGVAEKLETKIFSPDAQSAIKKTVETNLGQNVAKNSFGDALKKSCNLKSGLLFAAFEFLADFMSGDIQAAFSKDKTTGMKQLGQTAVKGAGSAIGWSVGEGIGAWAGAKLGASIGTAISPGLGTAIGAVAGLIGGSIGCWAMGKLTHKLVGDNVGAKVQAEQMGKTPEGQVQLLQLTAQKAEQDIKDGKQVDPRTLQAINNVATVFSGYSA